MKNETTSTKEQNYNNHLKWYVPHHFFFYAITVGGMCFSLGMTYVYQSSWLAWCSIAIAFACIAWLSYMLRQHYALGNQNRIVRLEMRLRYYILTQKPFDQVEKQLSFGQIAALRFAGDEEFLSLLDRALQENLSPDDIKKSVQNWQADHMRV